MGANVRRWLGGLSKSKKIILICVLSLLVLGTGASAWYYQRLSDLEKMFPEVMVPGPEVEFPDGQDTANPGTDDIRGAFAYKTLNILLLGFDRDEARDEIYTVYRTDTIMVASINLDSGKVNVVSIPRDTLVPIYNMEGARDKINSAYTYGWRYGGAPENDLKERHRTALNYQIQTVSQTLKGVPIHYYMTIDMDGVVEVVDTIGGIWYDVEKRVYDKQGRLIVGAGRQLLDGETFLRFVRNRNYRKGDLQRVKNQQNIMLAAFSQFKSTGTLLHAPQIYSSMNNRVDTNLSLEQMMSLALFASQKVEEIETHVLEASFANGRLHESWKKSYSYLIINQQKRADLLRLIWGMEVTLDPTDKILPPLPSPKPVPEPEEDSPLVPVDDDHGQEDDPKPENGGEPEDGEFTEENDT